MNLIHVADAAFPAAMSTLDASVKAVCGYVGQQGYTPHIWTQNEVQAVRNSGRQWWPIWVPPQGVMTAQTGTLAAVGMIKALPSYGVSKTCPVFFDVETNAWEASQSGARAAISAWQAGMRAAGYTRPIPYVPYIAGFGWVARYIARPAPNVPPAAPTSLPAGTVGWQYANPAIAGGSWDRSVFDASLLTTPQPTPDPNGEDDMSAADVTAINAHVDQQIAHAIHAIEASVEQRLTDHNAAMESKVNAMVQAVESTAEDNGKTLAEILKVVQS